MCCSVRACWAELLWNGFELLSSSDVLSSVLQGEEDRDKSGPISGELASFLSSACLVG